MIWPFLDINPLCTQWILPSGFIQSTWNGSLYIPSGHRVRYTSVTDDWFYLIANSADSEKMLHSATFIRVCTVCQSTRLSVSSTQRVPSLFSHFSALKTVFIYLCLRSVISSATLSDGLSFCFCVASCS